MTTATAGTTVASSTGSPRRARSAGLGTPEALTVALAALGSLAAAVWFVWWTRGFAPDDAFITYRYAANLADGEGWTYNADGSSANGATSALYVLVLAAAQLVHAGPETNAAVVSVLGLTVAGTCCAWLLHRLVGPAAAVLGAGLVVVNPWFPLTRGMESTLLLALAASVLAVAFLVDPLGRRGEVLLGVLAAATVTTRAESGLLVVLVLAMVVWRDRRVPWWTLTSAAVVVLGWSAVLWAMTGSALPATLGAKMAQARSGYWGPETAFLTAWEGALDGLGLWPWFWAVAAGAALSPVAAWRRPALRPFVLVVAGWGASTMLVIGLVIRVPGYFWYYAPPCFCLLLLGAVGWGWVASLVPWRAAGVALALVATVGLGLFVRDHSLRGFQAGAYAEVADWLRTNTAPDATVAAAEIGVVGFYSERPVVDFLGLLDTRAADDLEEGDLTSWISRTPPDVFVTHQPIWIFERGALGTDGFARAYTLVAGDRGMWVFERRADVAADAATGPVIVAPEPFLAALTDAGVIRTAPDEAAVQALVAVLVSRPDLQGAFVTDEGVDATRLLAWGRDATASPVPDSDTDRLAAHAEVYPELAERSAGLGIVPFTDPLLG